MQDNNSYHYPQGFDVGHLFFILKRVGDRDFSYPLRPEDYCMGSVDSTIKRQTRYKIWAMIGLGLLKDDRLPGSDPLSYQQLTALGHKLYKRIVASLGLIPSDFFTFRTGVPWNMTYASEYYLNFVKNLEVRDPLFFNLFESMVLDSPAVRHLLRFFVLVKRRPELDNTILYSEFFQTSHVQEYFRQKGLIPPRRSFETARRRIPILIGLLEAVNVMEGYGRHHNRLFRIPRSMDLSSDRLMFLEEVETIDDVEREIEDTERAGARELSSDQRRQLLDYFERRATAQESATLRPHIVRTFPRDPRVSALVAEDRNYICELCSVPMFKTRAGSPYCEIHHIIPRRKGGKDAPSNMVVLCPVCHRKIHYGTARVRVDTYRVLARKGIYDDFETLRQKRILSKREFDMLTGT